MEQYVLAPLWRRGFAWWVDQMIISVPIFIWFIRVWVSIGIPRPFGYHQSEYFSDIGLALIWLLMLLSYFTVGEAVWGKTLGKWLLGIKVIKDDGSVCGWHSSLLRNLTRFFDGLFFWWIGAAAIMITKKRQRIGDKFAGTVVVKYRSEKTC